MLGLFETVAYWPGRWVSMGCEELGGGLRGFWRSGSHLLVGRALRYGGIVFGGGLFGNLVWIRLLPVQLSILKHVSLHLCRRVGRSC